jgi:hypothetical protein
MEFKKNWNYVLGGENFSARFEPTTFEIITLSKQFNYKSLISSMAKLLQNKVQQFNLDFRTNPTPKN